MFTSENRRGGSDKDFTLVSYTVPQNQLQQQLYKSRLIPNSTRSGLVHEVYGRVFLSSPGSRIQSPLHPDATRKSSDSFRMSRLFHTQIEGLDLPQKVRKQAEEFMTLPMENRLFLCKGHRCPHAEWGAGAIVMVDQIHPLFRSVLREFVRNNSELVLGDVAALFYPHTATC